MTKQAPVGLTEPGEYDVVLKDVRVERFNPQRGKSNRRLCWTLTVHGGDHHKQSIYLNMPLRDDELPWAVCKALRAFGIDPDGQQSVHTDADGRPTDSKLAPGARARATVVRDGAGNTSVRLASAA
ncbi:MAG TPA: hypothetical protein VLJ76_04070 [Gaiellaceae bacterium]|nr:hypothetical protein [Gaiellaceae bacterium]